MFDSSLMQVFHLPVFYSYVSKNYFVRKLNKRLAQRLKVVKILAALLSILNSSSATKKVAALVARAIVVAA